ncbi:MAG: DUF1015 domain-containing protein [Ruminococcaceae bacterium]|nr:DUF1015 domain-containing protein [Oscillospiraceae bacterium]
MDRNSPESNMRVFSKADILLPKDTDLSKWSCIACDQFTSKKAYWEKCYDIVGEADSTLNLIIPEAYLDTHSPEVDNKKIFSTMKAYLDKNIFRLLKDSMVYVRREVSGNKIRQGIIGKVDLEAYSWKSGEDAGIRATEETIESRLPVRSAVRRVALIELPHIILFLNDIENKIIPSAAGGEILYDFELMQGGGRVTGSHISTSEAERIEHQIENLQTQGTKIAVGDGNHSLAAAKYYWDSIKNKLSADEIKSHPSRFALVELVNVYDSAINIEPIHRAVINSNVINFMSLAEDALKGAGDLKIKIARGNENKEIRTKFNSFGELVANVDIFFAKHIKANGGIIDYIHGDEDAIKLANADNSAAILLPKPVKEKIFTYIEENGSYPKKSFSVGEARDKRYYLECRKITLN